MRRLTLLRTCLIGTLPHTSCFSLGLQFSQQGPGEFIDYNSHAAIFNSKAHEKDEKISLRSLLLLLLNTAFEHIDMRITT